MGSIIDKYDGKKSFLKLSLPYLVSAAAPIDLRTVADMATDLADLIDAGCVYDGMKVWVKNEGREYICRFNAGKFSFSLYQIDTSSTIDHLTETKQIQGHGFNGTQDVESGFVYPEQLTIPDGQTLDNVLEKATNTDESLLLKAGFYYCKISGVNISVVMERIGEKVITTSTEEEDNVQITTYTDHSIYKITLTTIDGGVIKTQYCVSHYDSELGKRTLNWKTVEYCANNNVIELNSNLTIDGVNVNFAGEFGDDEAEKWLIAIHGNDAIPANADKIIDRNGREFSFGGGVTEAVSVPFIVKLIGQNAYVVNIKADSINFGLVRLSDSYIDDQSGVNSGVAATPKAVAGLNATLSGIIRDKAPTNHASTKTTYGVADASKYGHIKIDADTANSLINKLTTGDSDPQDNDYYVSQYVNGGSTTTTYHRRPIVKLWNYIKSKILNGNVIGNSTNYGAVKLGSYNQNGATAADGVAAPNGHWHTDYVEKHITNLMYLGFNTVDFVVAIIHFDLGTGSILNFQCRSIFGSLQVEKRTSGYMVTSSDRPGNTYGLWFYTNKSMKYRGVRIDETTAVKIRNGTGVRKTVGLMPYTTDASMYICIGAESGGDFLIIGF
ncbi:MAG: hypothetical protein IKO46_05910 [Salinivirgaceae bacterium]|nr:hypothetical protein [Salinivirgaceae bacterium]